jgi:hypothetical protein
MAFERLDALLDNLVEGLRSASVAAHIPKFECGVNPLNDPLADELLVRLRTDLKYRQKITMSMRRICLFISCSGLGGRVNYARIYIEGNMSMTDTSDEEGNKGPAHLVALEQSE